MSVVQTPLLSPAPPARAAASHPRDTVIDIVRAACVMAVVLLHALMVGVTVGPAGPVFANAADGAGWIVPVTWLLQVMPLFFVIGGFSGLRAHRARRDARGFVAARVHRLLLPALGVIGAAGLALLLLGLSGVSPELVAIAGFRFGQPLWFLGVFLLCQALLPALVVAHARAPFLSLALLATAAVAVDIARLTTGIEMLGVLNLAFVWLTLQQLGFHLADGRIDRLPARTRIAVGAGALGVLVALVMTGVLSPDLLENLNPPTVALLLVGVAQTALLSLLRGPIGRWGARPAVARTVAFITPRTMTVYLWHMPVLLSMAGASALWAASSGMPLPEPGTMGWWASRPLWIAVALVLTAIVAVPLSRIERSRAPRGSASSTRLAVAVTAGVLGVVLLLVASTNPLTALIAVMLFVCALRLSRAPRPGSRARAQGEDRGRGR